jgi:hypothetical protein
VLAMIGHVQAESGYISNHAIKFQTLFGSDIAFLNHRNFSTRSAKLAVNSHDIASDVVSFAKYFQRKNKKIVLYGMCGGAVNMVLAANILMRENIPFKLIVDRFFSNYVELVSLKAARRLCPMGHAQTNIFLNILSSSFARDLHFILYQGINAILNLTHNNPDFPALIRNIPEQDLLILQGKSPKLNRKENLSIADHFIHPHNDIRNATNDRRHERKMILKSLILRCEDILAACEQAYDQYISFIETSFADLIDYFKKFLQLIDNEKLTVRQQTCFPHEDLHPKYLDDLTTRHHMPIKDFLRGFFKPAKIWEANMAAVKHYPSEIIFAALKESYSHAPDKEDKVLEFADALSAFLFELKKNENFICHIGNRLAVYKFDCPLERMRRSKIFIELAKKEIHASPRLA